MMNNLKLAIRSLFKTPAVSIIAILTLAIGIGSCTAMFSLLNAQLLRPLAFRNPEQLFKLQRAWDQARSDGFAPADFADLKQSVRDKGEVAAFAFSSVSLAEPGRPPEWQNSLRVSSNFFEFLGLVPELGRAFTPEDDVRGKHRVVILNHALWQDQFGGSRDIIGRIVRLDGEQYEVVGVLPASANERRLFGNSRLFKPLALADSEKNNREMTWLSILFRRSSNLSAKQASVFIASVGDRVAADHPAQNKNVRWIARDLLDSTLKPTGRTLVMMLVGLSAFVLLIACSNLGNLLLARAMGRTREFTVRAALGASRVQLLVPVGLESFLLAITGGAIALFITQWTCDWIGASIIRTGDVGMNLQIDWRVLTFASAVSILTVLIFGVAPSLFATRVSVNEVLKSQTRSATASRGHQRLRSLLITGQFALAMTLLAGAGFFLQGARKALNEYNGWSSAKLFRAPLTFRKIIAKIPS